MSNGDLRNFLHRNNACASSIVWIGEKALAACWRECTRGDWMLWLLARAGYGHATIGRINCAIVRRTPLADGGTVWDLLTDPRSRRVIEVTERYADGLASPEELDVAGAEARAAARDLALDSVLDTYWAAARAASWVVDWPNAHYSGLNAATASARAASWTADWDVASAAQADIIREYVPMILMKVEKR